MLSEASKFNVPLQIVGLMLPPLLYESPADMCIAAISC
nr:MAG TPA_asm: hypothetical protein [Caudoviricetes sp.]